MSRRRWLMLVLLLVAGCGVGLVVIEAALRLQEARLDGVRHQFVEDRVLLHHRLLPHFDGLVRGVRFTTNSLGLRDREFAVPKPAGTFRVAVLGDSFTEGGLDDADTMPRRLEARLRTRSCGPGVEVVSRATLRFSTTSSSSTSSRGSAPNRWPSDRGAGEPAA